MPQAPDRPCLHSATDKADRRDAAIQRPERPLATAVSAAGAMIIGLRAHHPAAGGIEAARPIVEAILPEVGDIVSDSHVMAATKIACEQHGLVPAYMMRRPVVVVPAVFVVVLRRPLGLTGLGGSGRGGWIEGPPGLTGAGKVVGGVGLTGAGLVVGLAGAGLVNGEVGWTGWA